MAPVHAGRYSPAILENANTCWIALISRWIKGGYGIRSVLREIHRHAWLLKFRTRCVLICITSSKYDIVLASRYRWRKLVTEGSNFNMTSSSGQNLVRTFSQAERNRKTSCSNLASRLRNLRAWTQLCSAYRALMFRKTNVANIARGWRMPCASRQQ